MYEMTTTTRNLIRRKTFQEATKGNSRTIYDIEEELQDVIPVSDYVRDNVLGRMNFIMDEARTRLTDTAVQFWVHKGEISTPMPEKRDRELESDSPVDTGVDEKMMDENGELSKTEVGAMWLEIVTDERKDAMKMRQKEKIEDGSGLEYKSARSFSIRDTMGEGQYSALGGAYIRFLPRSLTAEQRKELDILTDSWDAYLAVFNSLVLKYKGLLQENGAVKIPGGPTITGKTNTSDRDWNDFMDNKKVRNPTLDYIMRNVRMFGKYYDRIARKTVSFSSSSASSDLATTLINAVVRDAVSGPYLSSVINVVNSVPKRINFVQERQSEDVEFQSIVPTFYADPDTGTFRVRMNILDARFSMDAVRKSGICWSNLRGTFDYTVRLRKFTVSRAVLKGVFGDNERWIEEGQNFLDETTGDGTNTDVETDDLPW